MFEDSAIDGLEGTGRQQVGAPVPADVAWRVEIVGDLWDCGRNDGAVQGDDESGKADSEGEEGEGKGARIFRSVVIVQLGIWVRLDGKVAIFLRV